MLRHHLIIAFRNLIKYKGFSLINFLGLTIGLATAMFILLYVQDELSYDQYHEYADRIYRLTAEGHLNGSDLNIATAPAPSGAAMVRDYPEVIAAARLQPMSNAIFSLEDKGFKEEHVSFADSTVFDVFSFVLLDGDPKTVLTAPYSMVITPQVARKYFGDKDPIGKTLELNNQQAYRITGLLKEMPKNSHFHFDILLSMSSLADSRSQIWLSFNYYTYLLLQEGVDYKGLEAKFPDLIDKYVGPDLERFLGSGLSDNPESGNRLGFFLQPLLAIHLHSALFPEIEPNSDVKYVYIFSIVAVFILLIACINFMNLSTARSSNRAREVGIKKVVGVSRSQLISQFLIESMLIAFLSVVIALVLVKVFLPSFNAMSGKELVVSVFENGYLIPLFILLALLTGLLAGSYPAFFLSSFQVVNVLKGDIHAGMKSGGLRKALVIFQFIATVILIIGTAVVYKQLNYIQNKKVGFEKAGVLILHDTYLMDNRVRAFKSDLLTLPAVTDVSVSSFLPVPSGISTTTFWPGDNPDLEDSYVINFWTIDHDYIQTMGMEITEGRDFSLDFPTDSSRALVNEALVRRLGWQDPIGKELSTFSGSLDMENNTTTYQVVGVIKDFHFTSLRENIDPVLMRLGNSNRLVSCRFQTKDISGLIRSVEEKWQQFTPGQPFNYSFLDERFGRMYQSEQRIGKIVGLFASLAIFVACLGLLGLVAYTAERRTREIGIRKVLGASAGEVVWLLAKDFGRLVLIAYIIALPIGWYVMRDWLQDFEYRTTIGAGTLIFSGLIILAISILAVSYHSIKAANVNPVDSLKVE